MTRNYIQFGAGWALGIAPKVVTRGLTDRRTNLTLLLTEEWHVYHNWAFLPLIVLERIFAHLGWRDRAMAALTCKRWLNAFCSPNVWRKFTYYPPPQGLTRLQYDIKTYYMARGIRAVGWHVQYLRFPETEDFFMLNRILSLIAEFLEAHPNTSPLPTDSILSGEDDLFSELAFLEAATLMTCATTPTSSSSDARAEEEERDVEEDSVPVCPSSNSPPWDITGDPNLDASIRLAIKLQQREFLRGSSSSSSESGIDFCEAPSTSVLSSSAPQHFPFRSASTTSAEALPQQPAQARGRPYQRSASCRYPAGYVMPARLPYPPDTSHLPPPRIRSFSLDFHSEYDEATNVVYGSGGAIFATICRVLCQLRGLRSLYLRNLFLSPQDARRMIMEITRVAGPTLERLSLLHVCKLAPEHSSPEASHPLPQAWHDEQLRYFVWGKQRDPYWYLRDPRWLSARPKHLGWNPLADLHYLFPNLHQLEISLAQLTGPMLLRLLFQTRLSLLIIVQTDLSPRLTTYDPNEAAPPRMHYVDSLENLDEAAEALDSDRSRDTTSIDWGADVPTSESFPHRVYTLDWRPIDPEFWRQARALRSDLRVEIKFRFLRPSTQLRSFALPALPAPVTSAVCVFGGSDQVSSYRLFERCLATLTRYSSTLTSLVFFVEVDLEALEAKEREEASRPSSLTLARFRTRRQITPIKEIVPKPLDEQLLKLLTSCPYVSSLSLGGRLLNIHLTTLGQICRLLVRASRRTPPPSAPPQAVRRRPNLCVDSASVRLSGELPDCTSARDSGIFTQLMQDCRGKEASPAAKARAAECFVSASLGVPRWRFMQPAEYRHHVNAL